MSFLKPKMPTPPVAALPPNPAMTAQQAEDPTSRLPNATGSLIATAAGGLRRRASVQRASLIGGGTQ